MYHYVRDGARVNARTIAEFEAQLDHIVREHTVVRLEDVRRGGLPDNACLLTFDDGLREHFDTVAPALERRGLVGVFCPPARPILERSMLDVQKTQFLLASSDDHPALAERILDLARDWDVGSEDELRARNTPHHRFDAPETVFVKRVLQDGLPDEPRQAILGRLFAELVSDDEAAFAGELYITLDECRELVGRGHDVAGHGYEHRRLGLLEEPAQRREIDRTKSFLAQVTGEEPREWAFCYPYGDRSATTLLLLGTAGCALGLTTDVGLADRTTPPLELPRVDTNDLPLTFLSKR